jgi:hypothetical protein
MDAALQTSPGNDGLILFNKDGLISILSRVPGSAEVFASPYAPGAQWLYLALSSEDLRQVTVLVDALARHECGYCVQVASKSSDSARVGRSYDSRSERSNRHG